MVSTERAVPRHPAPPPPTGTRHPLVTRALGSLPEFGEDTIGFLADLSRRQPGVAPFRMGPVSAVAVSSAEALKQVLVSQSRKFSKGDLQRSAMVPVLRKGLLISEGEMHQAQRKLLAPMFAGRKVNGYLELIGSKARHHADRLVDGERVDVLQMMGSITRDVIRTLLWTESVADDEDLTDAVTGAFEWEMHKMSSAVSPPVWAPTRRNLRMRRDVEKVRSAIGAIIEERRGEPDRHPDVLGQLLTAVEDGHEMDRDHLVDELVTLWGAAHETSADAQFWTAYLLARHPDIRARVELEADEVLGDGLPTEDTLPCLPWAAAVFREAMRLFPPASVLLRQAEEETVLAGVPVSKGTLVFLNIYSLHRDPDLYPAPEEFRPERFADTTATTGSHRFAYLPFGAGPHVCIGSTLALTEGTVFTSVLARRLRLHLDGVTEVRPQLLINLRPRGDVGAIVEKRHPAPGHEAQAPDVQRSGL